MVMDEKTIEALQNLLARLIAEHRALDDAIASHVVAPNTNLMTVQILKKKKLELKDRIEKIKNQLMPDIIA